MADAKTTALTELDPVSDDDIAYIVDDPIGSPLARKITMSNIRKYLGLPDLLHVREEQAAATEGGTSSSATWNIRVLNTVKTNEITGASLAANQITLPAGTYRIEAYAPALDMNACKLALYNVTDAANEVVGSAMYSVSTDLTGINVPCWGRFTIAAEKVFELRHYTQTGRATTGLGTATNIAMVEVYAEVLIWKEPA